MPKTRLPARAGRWPGEFEKDNSITVEASMAKQNDIEQLFRFFNEIGIIAQLSQNMFESVLPHGLTLSQFSVLNHFVRLGRIESPARLAKSFQVTKGAMTNTLARLEKRGFITINPDPADGRAKLVDITGAGRQAQRDCLDAVIPMLETVADNFDILDFRSSVPHLEQVRIFLDDARG